MARPTRDCAFWTSWIASLGNVDWSQVDTVLLDMDGTLLDLHFDNRFWNEHLPRCYAQARGLDEAAARAELMPVFAQQFKRRSNFTA